tara:strand:+ start:12476 stop:12832 length:357 start_codon:yes stop_codon:yes gene_type:complete
MAYSLFDKLGQHIDITAGRNAKAPMHPPNTPAQHTPELEDVAKTKAPTNMTGMKFTHSLIKHLDQLYSKMLAGEVADIASEPKYSPKTRVIQGQTDALILEEKEAYYNPGNSNVTESF